MNYTYECKNVVYIKNLSPTVTENDIKTVFSDCGEILSLSFHNLSGNNRRYLKLEFKDSAGVTGAALKNGQLMCGFPMYISVMDPQLSYENEAKSGAVSAAVAQLSNSAMGGFYGANSKQSKAIEAIMYYGTTCTISSNISDAAKLLASQTEYLLPTKTQPTFFLKVQYHPDIEDFYLQSTFSNATNITISTNNPPNADKVALLEFDSEDKAEKALEIDTILNRKISITRLTNNSLASGINAPGSQDKQESELEHSHGEIRPLSRGNRYGRPRSRDRRPRSRDRRSRSRERRVRSRCRHRRSRSRHRSASPPKHVHRERHGR